MERNEFKEFGAGRMVGGTNPQRPAQQQQHGSMITENPAPNASPPSAPADTYVIVKR